MKIKKMIIQNFRGINEAVTILFNEFNVIVGKNDVGKSTILKAIDLFINNNETDINIKNLRCSSDKIEIVLCLDLDGEDIELDIDEGIKTTIIKEGLINNDSQLQIKREWTAATGTMKPTTYIWGKHYKDNKGEEVNILLANEKDLITACKNANIDTKKAHDEQYNNVEKRVKLREAYAINNTCFDYFPLAATGQTRSKRLNDAINLLLPGFEYFKADSSLSDSDKTVQSFFKSLATDEINNLSIELKDDKGNVVFINKDYIQEKVDMAIKKVLATIAEKINIVVDTDEEVEPDTKFDWAGLAKVGFKSANKDDGNLPLSFRGDGFRRITMMAYFEYLAESKEHRNIIFGFEEPETFLHPSAQENLFKKLLELTENGYQVILTTHSPVIVANSPCQDVIHVTRNTDRTYCLQQNIDSFTDIVNDLGITVRNQFIREFDKAKALLLVEGIDDANSFHYVSEQYKANGRVNDSFNDLQVVIVPMGGCDSIQHWVTLNLLQNFDKPFYIILDSDKDSAIAESKTLKKLLELGFIETEQFHVLRKRMLENYINPKAILRLTRIDLKYNDYTHIKNLSKKHENAGLLGGKNIADKWFCKQNYNEIEEMFKHGSNDEFADIYNKISEKI